MIEPRAKLLHSSGLATSETFSVSTASANALQAPKLDNYEHSASLHGRCEVFREVDFTLLQMLMRYPDECMSREELKRCFDRAAEEVSDRQLDTAMRRVMQKILVLWPVYPLVRFEPEDSYVYSEKAPKKPKRDD